MEESDSSEAALTRTSKAGQNGSENIDFKLLQLFNFLKSLMGHSIAAGGSQEEIFQEIESWGHSLDKLVQEIMGQVAEANGTVQQLAGQVEEILQETDKALRTGLEQALGSLDARADQFRNTLNDITRIGGSVRMLAMNATIESARAGEAGRGFGVVASEVRSLAQHTMKRADLARQEVRLDDVRDELVSLTGRMSTSFKKLSKTIEHSNSRLDDAFQRSRNGIQGISEQSRVLWEALGNIHASADRIRSKDRHVEALLEKSVRIWADDQPAVALDLMLRHEHIRHDPGFDRLDDIRRRGVLRVAVEPEFKGLSFRHKGSPLQGLDIDYAQAFGTWLGVRTEFVEYPWDRCTELLSAGRKPGEAEVDLVWSALPPHERWQGVAYSKPYTYLHYVLARRSGDSRIKGIEDLGGKVLGCINDPAALATLEAAGLRWAANRNKPGGKVALANLVVYSDQSRIHDCLTQNAVDAFAVDQPIYHWACVDRDSPWHGRIETLPGNIAATPWYYAVGVADLGASYRLLRAVNEFIDDFWRQPRRAEIERRWQGTIVTGNTGYWDEPGHLRGEPELAKDHARVAS